MMAYGGHRGNSQYVADIKRDLFALDLSTNTWTQIKGKIIKILNVIEF